MPLRYRRVTYRYTAPGADVEQFFRRIWDLNRQQTWTARARWRPPTDVLEGSLGLSVKIELAGMQEDDVDVALFDDMLVVSGSRVEEPVGGLDCHSYDCRYHESGVRYGDFRVEVYLPLPVDPDRVVARYDRGFLYVTLPRRED
jgi:HSP20 family protein